MSRIEQAECQQCGAPIDLKATTCKFCGAAVPIMNQPQATVQSAPPQSAAPQQTPPNAAPPPYYNNTPAYNTSSRSKVAAGIIAIFLGSFGIHKFYLGNIGMGIVYLLFCWTGIPGLIGLIEGIIYLCSSDEVFYQKYVVKK